MPIETLLVDGQRLFREGLKAMLRDYPEVSVVGEANDGLQALDFVRKRRPQLMLTGLRLTGLNGVDLITEVVRASPGTRIVVVSACQNAESVIESVKAGASGYVLKNCTSQELLTCVGKVSKGISHFCTDVHSMMVAKYPAGYAITQPHIASPLDILTKQEVNILRLAIIPKQNKEIADIMELTPHTVRTYRKKLMKKIGVTNLLDMTRWAEAAGLRPLVVDSDDI